MGTYVEHCQVFKRACNSGKNGWTWPIFELVRDYTIYNIYEIHKDQAKNEGARAVTSIWYPVAMATKVFKRSA